jgi:uncharacterized damage-inducible protein DinB
MNDLAVTSLQENLAGTIAMLRDTIERFTDETWTEGVSAFQVPAKVAYHALDCLDFYFKTSSEEYVWGHRFDGGWWTKRDEEQPSPEDLLGYLDDLDERIDRILGECTDEDLAISDTTRWRHGSTRFAHYVYALRHTSHHAGALSVLARHHRLEPGEWR